MAKKMKKKFWERRNFDMALFHAVFTNVYGLLYNNFNETVKRGDALLGDKGNAELLERLCAWRQDFISSDRETASFAIAYEIFAERFDKLP